MSSDERFLPWSYLALLLGAVSVGALFAVSTNLRDFNEPLPYLSWFFLWLASPFCLLALNIFIISRFLMRGSSGPFLFAGAVLFVLSGFFIYMPPFFRPAGGIMELNLVFIFGPLHHFGVAVLVTIGYLVKSIAQLIAHKPRRSRHENTS